MELIQDKAVRQFLEIPRETLYTDSMKKNSYELITSFDFPDLTLNFETKRDLVRYYTLYNKGGLFADTNVMAFDINKLYGYELVLIKDELFQNNIILAKPGIEIFKTLYELLLKNTKNGIKTDYKRIFHNEVTSFIENTKPNIKILHASKGELNEYSTKHFELPKGSWIHSSKDYSMKGNILTVECADYNGIWIKNNVIISPGVEYYNENGIIKCPLFTTFMDEKEVFFSLVPLYEDEPLEEFTNKKIFMTYKKNVPNKVFSRWKVLNPTYEFDFSLDEDCINFLEKLNSNLSELFNKISVGMYKADLWRLCKLYINGGIYADVDLIPYLNIDSLDKDVTFYSSISIDDLSIFQAFIVNHRPKSGLIYLMLLSLLLNNPYDRINGPTYDMYNFLKYNINETLQPFKKYHLDVCKLEIKIGSSSTNNKQINLLYFPLEEYDIQLKPNGFNDLFEFSVKDNILTVTRIDIDDGWGHEHYCELIIKSKEVVYLFKEIPGRNNQWQTSSVHHNDKKILDSRDMEYHRNGGW